MATGQNHEELKKLKKFFEEFKAFAIKGNMIDLAVGVIIGGAFTAIVNALVGNIATPLLGILIGVDFSAWEIELPKLYGNAPPGKLGIGSFLNTVISFIVVSFVVFIVIKAINKFFRKQAENPPAAPPKQEVLLTEIRDILMTAFVPEPESGRGAAMEHEEEDRIKDADDDGSDSSEGISVE